MNGCPGALARPRGVLWALSPAEKGWGTAIPVTGRGDMWPRVREEAALTGSLPLAQAVRAPGHPQGPHSTDGETKVRERLDDLPKLPGLRDTEV